MHQLCSVLATLTLLFVSAVNAEKDIKNATTMAAPASESTRKKDASRLRESLQANKLSTVSPKDIEDKWTRLITTDSVNLWYNETNEIASTDTSRHLKTVSIVISVMVVILLLFCACVIYGTCCSKLNRKPVTVKVAPKSPKKKGQTKKSAKTTPKSVSKPATAGPKSKVTSKATTAPSSQVDGKSLTGGKSSTVGKSITGGPSKMDKSTISVVSKAKSSSGKPPKSTKDGMTVMGKHASTLASLGAQTKNKGSSVEGNSSMIGDSKKSKKSAVTSGPKSNVKTKKK